MLLLTSNCSLEFYNLLSQTLSHSLCQGLNTLNSNVKSDTAFKGDYYIITVFECQPDVTFKDGYYVITVFESRGDVTIKGGYSIITVFECRTRHCIQRQLLHNNRL